MLDMTTTLDFLKTPALEVGRTNRCAVQPVLPQSVFHFRKGLPAFEDVKNFTFLVNEQFRPFVVMQALDSNDLCFICLEPFAAVPDYSVKIPTAVAKAVELERCEDALLLAVATIPRDPKQITVNLMSPILLNMKTRLGQQLIIEDSVYPVQFRLWDAVEKGLCQGFAAMAG